MSLQVDTSESRSTLSSACFAPHSALYLRPDGLVHACCTTGFSVGSVTGKQRESLREIWNGAALREQRQFLEADRFDLGCQECEWIAETGGRDASLAVNFDRFSEGAPHRFPKLMDLALSNRCNLQCVMCNGDLSSTIRAQREGRPPLPLVYDEEFFEQLDEFLPHLERMQFKGGEPFLGPENRRIWDRLIEIGHRPEITVTTNGTVMNPQVERYITELKMHPIVSVDAVSVAILESIRIGVDGAGLWSNIDRFQELAEMTGRGMTLSFCLLRSNWRELLPFLEEADRRGVNCNVIVVNQPHEHDLMRLGHVELERVCADLMADTRTLSSPVAKSERENVINRIKSQLDSPSDFVTQATVPIDSEVQDSLIADLTEEYGRRPLVIGTKDGVIDHVDAPEWSAWLSPQAFMGRRLDEMDKVLGAVFGNVQAVVTRSRLRWVTEVQVTLGEEPHERELIAHTFVDGRDGSAKAVLVEVPDQSNSCAEAASRQ